MKYLLNIISNENLELFQNAPKMQITWRLKPNSKIRKTGPVT